jgi:hypothetical protein
VNRIFLSKSYNNYLKKIGSGETDMNRFSSHPNHENRPLYEGPQPQDLSEARREGSVFF